jgi:hypothetical protein
MLEILAFTDGACKLVAFGFEKVINVKNRYLALHAKSDIQKAFIALVMVGIRADFLIEHKKS